MVYFTGVNAMKTILLVEDDRTIAMGLEYSLRQEGYDVLPCGTAAQARSIIAGRVSDSDFTPQRSIAGGRFDLAILDLNLPDGSGYDLCRLIRQQGSVPVVFLTAYDDEVNVVMGLDMGADDYISKPFRVRELLSRLRTVLRRSEQANDAADVLHLGDVIIHTRQAKVSKNGDEVPLTALEYRLLLTLASHGGQVLTRAQLLEGIWDIAGEFVNDNTLSVYIKRLREKIEEDPQHPRHIQTVRGLGYRMED